MSTLNVTTALEVIEQNEGETITYLRAILIGQRYPAKIVNLAIAQAKEDGILDTRNRSTGFVAGFYAWLKESSRTKDEAIDYIHDGTSDNVKRHETHYLGVWELTESIRVTMELELAA